MQDVLKCCQLITCKMSKLTRFNMQSGKIMCLHQTDFFWAEKKFSYAIFKTWSDGLI